jgi:hypothetical protein
MRLTPAFLLMFAFDVCAHQAFAQDFSWPKDRDAISDEQTAIAISVAIFHGQFDKGWPAPNEIAKRLEAFRYRTSDLVHDPKGDAWFVQPSAQEEADFDKQCANRCVGGDLYRMALSAHDGRVLEFYLPQ